MWAQATLNTVSETSSKKGKQKNNMEQIKKTYAPSESGKKSWSKKWDKTAPSHPQINHIKRPITLISMKIWSV